MVRLRSPKRIEGLLIFSFIVLLLELRRSVSACRSGCDLAIASYFVSQGLNLTFIASLFGLNFNDVLPFNPSIGNGDSIQFGSRIDIGFRCDCLGGGTGGEGFLGHEFVYSVKMGDTYDSIAELTYANLTTPGWLESTNRFSSSEILPGVSINITVNCSCGDPAVSEEFGLFVTYPLRPGESLGSVAAEFGFSANEGFLQSYNPGVNFSSGEGMVFVPTKDPYGSYHPLYSSNGISREAISGICVAGAVILLAPALLLYLWVYRKKRQRNSTPVAQVSFADNSFIQNHVGMSKERIPSATPSFTGITIDKSVEFSYEELAKATNDFSVANKIGEGGFGSVYYGELRGERAAIKRMDLQATREFLAELRVLTRVHHLNLVRLIGYCTETSLFLVYEFIDNGNLSEHLHGSMMDPLPWPARVQIALDSARGLEYIHEHTVPVYIHRDIKSANILIDKSFHAKVADFGLTKLTEVGSTSLLTRLVGTFGYMPPEYAQYGDVSPKVDVYAFGVVLYELISAKEAIVKTDESATDTKGLVALFEDALRKPEPKEDLLNLMDPRLGDNCPIDSIHKMALLAKACTEENPQLRPSMRTIVVALMTLSSTTEEWEIGSFNENQALFKLMSGR